MRRRKNLMGGKKYRSPHPGNDDRGVEFRESADVVKRFYENGGTRDPRPPVVPLLNPADEEAWTGGKG